MKSSELAAAVRLALARATGATCENEASGIRIYDLEPGEVLWDADTKCDHDIESQPGGAIKCTKCTGWFCFQLTSVIFAPSKESWIDRATEKYREVLEKFLD